jgi:hypothetical protein
VSITPHVPEVLQGMGNALYRALGNARSGGDLPKVESTAVTRKRPQNCERLLDRLIERYRRFLLRGFGHDRLLKKPLHLSV